MLFPSRALRRALSFLSLTLLGTLLFSTAAQALILKAEDEVFFNEYVTQDVYLAGGTITVQQDIEGDLYVAGGNITLNGVVSGDLFVVGGNVVVNREVKDDVRVVGGSLSLNAKVGGDLVVVGGNVDVQKDVVVEGDMVMVSGAGNMYGTVNRSVKGVMGRLELAGTVNGNEEVRVTEKLVLLNEAHVAGNVTYFAPERIEDHGGKIDGKISYNEILSSTERVKEGFQKFFNRSYFATKLWSYLSLLLIGAFFLYFLPHLPHRASEKIRGEGLKSFGMGLMIFVLGGVLAGIAALTVIGIQLAFMMTAFLFILGEISRVMAAYWLGNLVIRHDSLKKGAPHGKIFWLHLGVLAVGLLIIKAVGLIPFVGWVAGFVFLMMGAGGLFLVQRSNYQHLVKEKMI